MKKQKNATSILTKSFVAIGLLIVLVTISLVFSEDNIAPSDDPKHNAQHIYLPALDEEDQISIQETYDDDLLSNFISGSCIDELSLTDKQEEKGFSYNYTYAGFDKNHQLTGCMKVRP